MEIKDSGARTNFESGAVRDIQQGKGRCDLLPLSTVSAYILTIYGSEDIWKSAILHDISGFMQSKDTRFLFEAIELFRQHFKICDPFTLILDASIHYEEGANKYGEHNWEKGIPLHSFIDSAIRHYLKCLRGDDDEPHDRAFIWNLLGACWTLMNRPDLDDIVIPVTTAEASELSQDTVNREPTKVVVHRVPRSKLPDQS